MPESPGIETGLARRVRWMWIVAAIGALVTAVAQTVRLCSVALERADVANDHRRFQVREFAYKEDWLRRIRAETDPASPMPHSGSNGTVYMIVDTDCTASQAAVLTLSQRPTVPNVIVTSFTNQSDDIREWLKTLGAEFTVLEISPNATPLRHLPRTITPVYLQMSEAGPTAVHVGAPREEWMEPFEIGPLGDTR